MTIVDPQNEPLVYVIIVDFNGHADTVECLESLKYLQGVNHRIIVCDNGSDGRLHQHIADWSRGSITVDRKGKPWEAMPHKMPPSPQMAIVDAQQARHFEPIHHLTIVSIGENVGFAGANNIGMAAALRDPRCAYVWLLNNDTVAHPDSLRSLLESMQARPDVGICGSTLMLYRDPEKCQGLGVGYNLLLARGREIGANSSLDELPPQEEVEEKIDYVIGASMLVSRDFVEKIGPMSEDYFLYYEEFDWATRARGLYRMGWAPSSVVHHKYGATIEAGGLKYTNIYYLNIGLLRFMRKYHPLLLPLSFVRIFLLMARALLRRQSGVIKILAMAIGDFLSGVRRRGKIEPTT